MKENTTRTGRHMKGNEAQSAHSSPALGDNNFHSPKGSQQTGKWTPQPRLRGSHLNALRTPTVNCILLLAALAFEPKTNRQL